MRTCLAISVVIHTAVMLWLMLAPNARTLEGAGTEPVMAGGMIWSPTSLVLEWDRASA